MVRNIYALGALTLSLAALNEGSVTGALVIAGCSLMAYALAAAINSIDV